MVRQLCHKLLYQCPVTNSFNRIYWPDVFSVLGQQSTLSNLEPQIISHKPDTKIIQLLPLYFHQSQLLKFSFPPYSIFGPNPEDLIASVAYHTIIYSLLISKVAQCNLMKTIHIETSNAHCLLTVPVGVQSRGPAELN